MQAGGHLLALVAGAVLLQDKRTQRMGLLKMFEFLIFASLFWVILLIATGCVREANETAKGREQLARVKYEREFIAPILECEEQQVRELCKQYWDLQKYAQEQLSKVLYQNL